MLISSAMLAATMIAILALGEAPSFARAAERALGSVASLVAIGTAEEGQSGRERIHGSAVIISADGLLITSRHLIARAEDVRVELPDGRELRAMIAGSDDATDIAVLRVDVGDEKIQPFELGDSAGVLPGDFVLAIGNPFLLGRSVTLGVVSSKAKVDVGVLEIEELIQTDAAINPGSSGGALVDGDGRLIGINTAIITKSGVNQGVGFAVPIEVAMPISAALARDGYVVRGWLGAELQDFDADLREVLGARTKDGALIADVAKGSPAEAAGLQREDIVVAVDGRTMPSAGALRNAISRLLPGARVTLAIERRGAGKKISVVLANSPPTRVARPTQQAPASLGLRVAPVETLRLFFAIPDWISKGAIVVELENGGVADLAGVEPGDVIVEVDRRAVIEPAEVERSWRAACRGLLLRVIREGRAHYLVLPVAKEPPCSN